MKELINKLMALGDSISRSSGGNVLALMFYLYESDCLKKRKSQIVDFSNYLYRFFSDNEQLRMQNPNLLIKNIYHVVPEDLYQSAKEILQNTNERTGLFLISNDTFHIDVQLDCEYGQTEKELLGKVIKMIINKHSELKGFWYSSIISPSELSSPPYSKGSRVFNRALEKCNYCFICEELDTNNLSAVSIAKDVSIIDSFIILCRDHCKDYLDKKIVIKKNGYAYYLGKRLPGHMDIHMLEMCRKYLPDIEKDDLKQKVADFPLKDTPLKTSDLSRTAPVKIIDSDNQHSFQNDETLNSFKIGSIIRHKSYGVGIIVGFETILNTTHVKIRFDSGLEKGFVFEWSVKNGFICLIS